MIKTKEQQKHAKMYAGLWKEFTVKEDEETRWKYKIDRTNEFFELAKLLNAKTLLDAGCGSGINSRLAEKQGFKVIGMDINPNVAIEREKGIKFEQGNLEQLKYANKQFDASLCMNIIMHIDDKKAIAQLKRVTKKIIYLSAFGEVNFETRTFEKTVRLIAKAIPFKVSRFILKRILEAKPQQYTMLLDNMYVSKLERHSEKKIQSMIGNKWHCIFRRYCNLIVCIAVNKEVLKQKLSETK